MLLEFCLGILWDECILFFQALSGVGEDLQTRAEVLDNKALNTALNTQFLFQIGVFTAIPMVLGFILEQGFLRVRLISILLKVLVQCHVFNLLVLSTWMMLQAIVSFITMQFQLCTVFFTFSLGTRTHYFGRAILHGGAKVYSYLSCFFDLFHHYNLTSSFSNSIMQPAGASWCNTSNLQRITGFIHAVILLKRIFLLPISIYLVTFIFPSHFWYLLFIDTDSKLCYY